MAKKTFDSYTFWNLEQLLFQAAYYYGEGDAEYDAAMTRNVNSVLGKINLPLFNPDWRENAEEDAKTLREPHSFDNAVEIISRFFMEYVKASDKWRDRTAHDFYDVCGTDEMNVYQNFVRVLAGIRTKIPA